MSQNLSAERVLITGASGFVGTHLLRRLHAEGAEITSVVTRDRLNTRYDALDLPLRRVVVEEIEAVGEVIRSVAPRYVIHLHAFISLDRTLRAVEQTMKANLSSTLAVLAACTEVKAERVILMGSCEEYGARPFDPTLALDPNTPYGASKAAATCYARMFYGSFQLPTVVLRPSVIYGPGQSPRMLISMVLRALSEGRPIAVTEGEQTRDFVYIDDVIDAILIAMQAPGIVGEAWNIGSGEIVTVKQCLELVERVSQRTGLIQYGARPYAESERFHYEPRVDATTLAFQWRASIMLEAGLKRTWHALHAGAADGER